MKKIKHLTALILVIAAVCSLCVLPASAATSNGQRVKIAYTGQVVDSLNGVDAVYATSNAGDDPTYSCAAYVSRYYQTIFGVSVYNLCSGCTPKVSGSNGYSFSQITSDYRVGDIVRFPGHWAIVKAVNGNELTLIEQNWKKDGYCNINRVVSASSGTVFRLCRNGVSANSGGAYASASRASAVQVASLLFDSSFYLSIYSDLQQCIGNDPAALYQHWINCGIREGRVASPFFDAKWYLANNADVAKCYGKTNYAAAYQHFIQSGFNEGRQGSPYFSVNYYLNQYSDLKAFYGRNYLGAARHFFTNGLAEGRRASAQFNIAAYDRYNSDVVRAYSNPLMRVSHYICHVQYGRESRRCV